MSATLEFIQDHIIPKNLTIKDGEVYSFVSGGPDLKVELHDRISVTRKESYEIRPEIYGENKICYIFRLSESPNPLWLAIFSKYLNPDLYRFQGDLLRVITYPAELESSYFILKDRLTEINDDYAKAKAYLPVIAKNQDDTRVLEAEKNLQILEEQVDRVNSPFEKLIV